MIGILAIEIDGYRYAWDYDPNAVAAHSWSWRSLNRFGPDPTEIESRLNRCFIEEHAAAVMQDWDVSDRRRLKAVLESMGARQPDFEKHGLDLLLEITDDDTIQPHRLNESLEYSPSFLTNPILRDWAFKTIGAEFERSTVVTCLGDGPFQQTDFIQFLTSQGISSIPLDYWDMPIWELDAFEQMTDEFWNQVQEKYMDGPDPPPHPIGALIPISDVIIGRNNWSADDVDDIIDRRSGGQLRIYSQEMFVAALLANKEPFDAPDDVLETFRGGHSGLEFVSEGWSGWVSTDVPPRQHPPCSDIDSIRDWPQESPLKVMDYTVGINGLSPAERQQILAQAFQGELPSVASPKYMAKWGKPNSSDRLHRIAQHLSSMCRIKKMQRNNPPLEAIEDWESDLEWLRETYYHGHFTFQWPNTFVG